MYEASLTTGKRGEGSNFMFTVSYFKQGESWLRDRTWGQQALDFDYGGDNCTGGKPCAIKLGSSRIPSGSMQVPYGDDGKTPTAACMANPLCAALAAADKAADKGPGHRWIPSPGSVIPGSTLTGWRQFDSSGGPTDDHYNYAAANYLTTPSTRVQAFSSGDVSFSAARLYYEASYTQRRSDQNAAPLPLATTDYGLSLSGQSIYNPFGADLPSASRRLTEFGNRTYSEDLSTFEVVTGIDGTLPEEFGPLHNWYWDVAMNYGQTAGSFTTGGSLRNSLVSAALGPSFYDANGVPRCGTPGKVIAGCVPINLFAPIGGIDPSQVAGLGYSGTSRAYDRIFEVSANTTGDLFTLGADRPASLAVGYDFRRQSGAQIADPVAQAGDSADYNFKSTQGYFEVHEAYAELSMPLLNHRPGIEDLELDVAGRFVDYNTFGTNFSGKIGLRYTPVSDLTLRGTFSTAFRAPSISELYLGQAEGAPTVTDPCANLANATASLKSQCAASGVPVSGSHDTDTQELAHNGGNPNLQPETAVTFTTGLVFQPRFDRNLSVTLDYYNINVDHIIGSVGAATILQGCYSGDSAPSNAAYCSLVVRNPAASGKILYVIDVNQNLKSLHTDGLDLAVRYALPTELGRFGFKFDLNYLHTFDRDNVDGTTFHGQGNYDLGALPAFKFSSGLDWNRDGMNVGGVVHFVGSFRECGTYSSDNGYYSAAGGLCNVAPGGPGTTNPTYRDVGAYGTLDLHASYQLTNSLGKTQLMVGLNNVFDAAPPFVYSSNLANSDPGIYDFLGRYFYGRVQHSF